VGLGVSIVFRSSPLIKCAITLLDVDHSAQFPDYGSDTVTTGLEEVLVLRHGDQRTPARRSALVTHRLQGAYKAAVTIANAAWSTRGAPPRAVRTSVSAFPMPAVRKSLGRESRVAHRLALAIFHLRQNRAFVSASEFGA